MKENEKKEPVSSIDLLAYLLLFIVIVLGIFQLVLETFSQAVDNYSISVTFELTIFYVISFIAIAFFSKKLIDKNHPENYFFYSMWFLEFLLIIIILNIIFIGTYALLFPSSIPQEMAKSLGLFLRDLFVKCIKVSIFSVIPLFCISNCTVFKGSISLHNPFWQGIIRIVLIFIFIFSGLGIVILTDSTLNPVSTIIALMMFFFNPEIIISTLTDKKDVSAKQIKPEVKSNFNLFKTYFLEFDLLVVCFYPIIKSSSLEFKIYYITGIIVILIIVNTTLEKIVNSEKLNINNWIQK